MRLLNTATKRLESFYGKNTPPYAILSHMWGREGDEFLFKHVAGPEHNRREGENCNGYAKIVAACEQAIKDGYGYIWIDTCCIDKESSAELSEAINSMYAWYRDADVCYAYLEDVHGGGEKDDQDSTFKTVSFERSRWFSRGWTLQELIAPRRMVFYSRDWVDIGTKATLQDTISNVTRIRVEMITGYDPKKASIAERMSWAAFRETTRDEDVAYSLMGIFGINMPLLYGEGPRAFMRLQEEIMRQSNDHSIFAWKTSLNPDQEVWETRGMLADSPLYFRDTGDIVPLNDKQVVSHPYSMTNLGLQIKLLLQPLRYDGKEIYHFTGNHTSREIFKAYIECTYRDSTEQNKWIIIYLEMTNEGHYVRVFPHWLDETKENPYAPRSWTKYTRGEFIHTLLFVRTPLLVMQVDPFKNSANVVGGSIKILPTESGFSFKGHSLVEGYDYSGLKFRKTEMIIFNREEKRFGVIIGNDDGIPWLDILEEDIPVEKEDVTNKIKSLYHTKKGFRCNMVARHLDRLSVNILKDWAVDVSAKLTRHCSSFEVIIDIRRVAEEQYALGLTKPSNAGAPVSVSTDSLPVYRYTHGSEFRKQGDSGWRVTFNPKVKLRTLDVELVHTFENTNGSRCICFSPKGEYLALGIDQTAEIYSIETGHKICSLYNESAKRINPFGHVHAANVRIMCFSPDSRLLAIACDDDSLRIWDVAERSVRKIKGEFTPSLNFSSNSQLIISGFANGTRTFRSWNITDGSSTVITSIKTLQRSTVLPNGGLVAEGREVIKIWDTKTSQVVQELNGPDGMNSIAFTPNGKGLISGGAHGTIKYWDVSGLEVNKPSRVIRDHTGSMNNASKLAVSHDGKWAASGSENNLLFWDLREANMQFVLTLLDEWHAHRAPPEWDTPKINLVDMSPVDSIFATSGTKEDVKIWRYSII